MEGGILIRATTVIMEIEAKKRFTTKIEKTEFKENLDKLEMKRKIIQETPLVPSFYILRKII